MAFAATSKPEQRVDEVQLFPKLWEKLKFLRVYLGFANQHFNTHTHKHTHTHTHKSKSHQLKKIQILKCFNL